MNQRKRNGRPYRLDYEQVCLWLEANEFKWTECAKVFDTRPSWLREVYTKHRGEDTYLETLTDTSSVVSARDLSEAMQLIGNGYSYYQVARHLTQKTGKDISRSAVLAAVWRRGKKAQEADEQLTTQPLVLNLPPLPPSMTNPDWGLHRFDPIIRQRLALESPR